jgi:hypothetical protein
VPVRADLKPLYPADWPEISRRVRFERAGGRCESCGRPHGIEVRVLPDGRWMHPATGAWSDARGLPCAHPTVPELSDPRWTRVVLTTAHIDHDPSNNADSNLAAWCQRCHLLHDAGHHQAQRRITVRLRSAIGDLFSGLYTLAGYPRNGAP